MYAASPWQLARGCSLSEAAPKLNQPLVGVLSQIHRLHLLDPLLHLLCQTNTTTSPCCNVRNLADQNTALVPLLQLLCRGWQQLLAPRHISINVVCERELLTRLLTFCFTRGAPVLCPGSAGGALRLGGSSTARLSSL